MNGYRSVCHVHIMVPLTLKLLLKLQLTLLVTFQCKE